MTKKIEDIKKKVANNDSEAWADADHYTEDGAHVNIPSEEAVERAKEYAENNAR